MEGFSRLNVKGHNFILTREHACQLNVFGIRLLQFYKINRLAHAFIISRYTKCISFKKMFKGGCHVVTHSFQLKCLTLTGIYEAMKFAGDNAPFYSYIYE